MGHMTMYIVKGVTHSDKPTGTGQPNLVLFPACNFNVWFKLLSALILFISSSSANVAGVFLGCVNDDCLVTCLHHLYIVIICQCWHCEKCLKIYKMYLIKS